MKDKDLEEIMLTLLESLEIKNDYCSDTPVRQDISGHIVCIRNLIKLPITPGYE